VYEIHHFYYLEIKTCTDTYLEEHTSINKATPWILQLQCRIANNFSMQQKVSCCLFLSTSKANVNINKVLVSKFRKN